MGKILPNGEIDFLGRIDNQVKISGHRIELTEIEKNINQIPSINESIIIPIESNNFDKQLFCFYKSKKKVENLDIIEYLSKKLPDYMIPSGFYQINEFPMTANAKIDRIELKKLINNSLINNKKSYSNKDILSLDDEIKIIISNKLEYDINYKDIKNNIELQKLGINSILFIQIIVDLENKFNIKFDDDDLFIISSLKIQDLINIVKTNK